MGLALRGTAFNGYAGVVLLLILLTGCRTARSGSLPESVPRTIGSSTSTTATTPTVPHSRESMPDPSSTPSGSAQPTTVVTTPHAEGSPWISAVELNFEDPSPGGQAIWLTAPAARSIDLSCWSLVATTSGTTATISPGTELEPAGVIRLSTPFGMLHSKDTVALLDPTGRTVDMTPNLTDDEADDRLWFTTGGEWRFDRFIPSATTILAALGSALPQGC